MRPKLLLALLSVAILSLGQAVAFPGAKTTPTNGGQTLYDKSQRNDPSPDAGNQPATSGDSYYSNADRDTKTGEDDPNTAVPEPGTLLLMGVGLAGAAWMRHRRNKV
jgi:hypothetical protein